MKIIATRSIFACVARASRYVSANDISCPPAPLVTRDARRARTNADGDPRNRYAVGGDDKNVGPQNSDLRVASLWHGKGSPAARRCSHHLDFHSGAPPVNGMRAADRFARSPCAVKERIA
jgi:hypothetical protein